VTWKRAAGWTAVGILSLVLLIVIGAAILLHSPKFHNYVISTVEQKASDTLNAQVQIRNFNLNLHNLTLDMDGVTVRSSEADPDKPLLSVDRLHANIKIVSLLQRTWYLNDIEVQHPVVHLYVAKDGSNNLPKPKSSGQKSQTNIFDLAVRHARLSNGEVYYNDRKSLVNADLHELSFQSNYDSAERGRYSGELGYRDGHLQYGNYDPLPHDLQAKFEATRSGMKLSPVVLTLGASRLALSSKITNYEAPLVEARYDALIDASQFRHVLKNDSLPIGTVRLAGNARYEDVPGNTQPLLETVFVDGTLTSQSLAVKTPTMNGVVRDLSAGFKLANGNAVVNNLRAKLLGGNIVANATVRDVVLKKDSRVTAKLNNISLADLNSMLGSSGAKNIRLTGTANATADATWHGSMEDLIAHSDANLQASITPTESASPVTVPIAGIIHADYIGKTNSITLTQSSLHTPRTNVDLNGTVSKNSAMQIRVQASDLRELDTIAQAFQAPKPGQPVQPLGLAGSADFNGTLRGSTANPTLTGQLSAANLAVKGSRWRSLRTNVQLSPAQASLQNGSLTPVGQGQIAFSGAAALRKWSYTPENPITLALNVSNLQLAELSRLANPQNSITGLLNANINIHGTQKNPIGQGRLALTNAKVSGETIQSVQAQFQGTGDVVKANLNLRLPAGSAQGNVVYYPKTEAYDANLKSTGFRLEQLQSVKARNLGITGVLNVNASGRGTIKNPQFQATIQIPQLKVQNQTVRNINLQTNVQNHVANFALTSDVVNTYIRAKGRVSLTAEYVADATLDTGGIPLQPLLATYMPAQASMITGQTELHATVRGPLKNKEQLEAHLQIPTFNLDYNHSIQLGAAAPIRADYKNGLLTLQPSEIKGTGTDLRFQGDVPFSSNAPATLSLLGNLDLRLAKLFDPTLASSGQLRFDVRSTGTLKTPDVKGQVFIENANLQTVGAPVGLQNANGVLTVSNNRMDISSFKGEIGGGTITASGGVAYRPALEFNLALAANGIDFVYQDQVRSGIDANLAFIGNKNASTVNGRVQVDRLSFTPDFDLTGFVSSMGGESSPPAAGGFTDTVKLDIAVQTAPSLNLVSRTLSIQGGANLHVQGTASQPVIVGRANLNGGDLIFRGNRYVVQNGTIDFVNPNRTQPVVNLEVTTVINQYNIDMRFQGPMDRISTLYTSDPALPPVDIINLLAFGKTTEASSANPSTPGVLGAESVLASGIAGQVTGQVEKLAGISHLAIDPVLAGGGQNPGARVAIQQRVTSNLYVTFATDVTSTQRQEVQVQYQINPRWSVSANRDQNGGFGFDARVHKTF
jgi:translocation and assembly module TamB